VGPHVVLQVILEASDRGVDRDRGTDRAAEVEQIMHEVSFDRSHAALPTFCLALMQNLSDDAQKKLGEDIRDLREATLDESVKSLILGLALMNAVGYDVLQGAVKSLDLRIRRVRTIKSPDEISVTLAVPFTVTANAFDADGKVLPPESLNWSSDTPAVASAAAGQILGGAVGDAVITLAGDGVKHIIVVHVVAPGAGQPLGSIAVPMPGPI
jgi:hypothetical protein